MMITILCTVLLDRTIWFIHLLNALLIDKSENDGLYCKLGTNNYNTLILYLSNVVWHGFHSYLDYKMSQSILKKNICLELLPEGFQTQEEEREFFQTWSSTN